MKGIVVGVDGSPQSVRALEWAVEEARARGTQLTVVHAWLPAFIASFPLTPVMVDPTVYEKAGQQLLDDAVDAVDTSGLVAPVERELVEEGPATALLHASEDADLVVIGKRGVGGFVGLLVGSVATQVVHHSSCPVVVVPA
jgi:nucleotide-binding universal stress UspA family protein